MRVTAWVVDVAGFGGAGFDASGRGDRWPLGTMIYSPVSQSLAAASRIVPRAEWLVANSPSAASFVDVWCNNLVSTGPTIDASHRPSRSTVGP